MNRIEKKIKSKNNILSIFFTAGFPALKDTVPMLNLLEKAGADMVEIGFPFSDPVADGEVIQRSSAQALKNGMTLNLLFEQLKDIRKEVTIPLILMGYLNPVFTMGMENFLRKCSETGIDGVILPDFPAEEYREHYREMFKKYGICNVLLITPQTPEPRIREIDRLSEGFIYMVSSYSTTGAKDQFDARQIRYFDKIKELQLRNPVLTGFGVSNRTTFQQACKYSAGAIVGSAFINEVKDKGPDEHSIRKFIERLIQD